MALSDTLVQGPGTCEKCEQHDDRCLMIEDKATGKLSVMHRTCYLEAKKENNNLTIAKIG